MSVLYYLAVTCCVIVCERDVQTSTKRVRSSDPRFCSPAREAAEDERSVRKE